MLPHFPVHPPLPSALWTSRQAASFIMESGSYTLCSPDTPPHLSYCCSPTVCVLILTLIDSGLGPGMVVGGKSHFFFSLILFFCLPSNLSPFPHQKKRKRQTQIKYLSGTVPLAQAASVCFVLPPSLSGLPPIWSLGPSSMTSSSPSTLSQPLSLLSLILSSFIASLYHDHHQLKGLDPAELPQNILAP